jgi:uncharacterized RDD family membrane protein YckC
MSSPVSAASFPPASLDRRFYAFVVDRAIAWGLDVCAVLVAWKVWWDDHQWWAGIGAVVAAVLLVGLGFAVAAGTLGTSPGKALFGLRLVDHDRGTPIGVGRALLRTLILGIGGIPTFGLGVATLAQTALLDPERQRRGWHDRVSRTVVVDLRPPPAVEEIVVERPHQIVNLTALRLAPVDTTPPTPRPAPAPARRPEPRPVPAAAEGRLALQPIPAPPAALATPPPPPPPPVEARSAGWTVVFDTGESVVVEGLGLVGRRPEGRPGEPVHHLVPLPSKDMSLSKTHAQFQVAPDGALVVMDRGSTNGSTLVRSGVSRDLPAGTPTSLLPGDVVRFGDRFMRVYRED